MTRTCVQPVGSLGPSSGCSISLVSSVNGKRYGIGTLSLPTLADGETWRDIRGFTPDVEALGDRGMAFERLDQLALEYLYGVR